MESKNIPMEAETIAMLTGGFSAVIAFTLFFIIFMMVRRKEPAYTWFLVQVLFLIGGFFSVLKVLNNTEEINSMLSENTSLEIGLSALMWAFSMICMIIGIYKIGRKKSK